MRLGGAPRAVAAGADGVWIAVGGDRARPAADAGAGAPVHDHCSATFYRGGGRPGRLIVTDLPLQGGVRLSAQQMAQAAAYVLGERGFRAGALRSGSSPATTRSRAPGCSTRPAAPRTPAPTRPTRASSA